MGHSYLETDLWKVELLCLPPLSPPSDWKPSSSGSTLPSLLLPRPDNRPDAKDGTDLRRCRLAREATWKMGSYTGNK